MTGDLARLSTDELLAQARAVRDAAFGTRVTFSPKVFVPLTQLCSAHAAIAHSLSPRPGSGRPTSQPDEVLAIARAGARVGCHEALFTLGERPEERYPVARAWLDEHGYASTVEYLVAMAGGWWTRSGCCPTPTPAPCSPTSWPAARRGPVAGDDDRVAQPRPRRPPGLARTRPPSVAWPPSRRPASWPSPSPPASWSASASRGHDRIAALEAIAASHRRWGHVQEVIVQNFLPKPGTTMFRGRPCPTDDYLDAIAAGPGHPAARRPPAGPTQPVRRLRDAARRRHRRLGRGLAGHRRPRQPRAALARPRPAAGGHRGPRPRAWLPG